jgi:hypothetical protein
MQGITIRAARPDEYDEVARVWMDSWVSIGLQPASEKLLADLRGRVVKKSPMSGASMWPTTQGGSPRCWRFD